MNAPSAVQPIGQCAGVGANPTAPMGEQKQYCGSRLKFIAIDNAKSACRHTTRRERMER
jgi:hypothetical protein